MLRAGCWKAHLPRNSFNPLVGAKNELHMSALPFPRQVRRTLRSCVQESRQDDVVVWPHAAGAAEPDAAQFLPDWTPKQCSSTQPPAISTA